MGGGSGGMGNSSGATSTSTSASNSGIIPPSAIVVGGLTTTASSGSSGSASSSSSSRLQVGLQASLHVQQWRLCLIGEPSAGCQFIAQWRLDALDAAYTMESSCNNLGGFAYDSVGGQNFLGFTPPGAQSVFSSFGGTYQNDDRFYLEANRAAGKGKFDSYILLDHDLSLGWFF